MKQKWENFKQYLRNLGDNFDRASCGGIYLMFLALITLAVVALVVFIFQICQIVKEANAPTLEMPTEAETAMLEETTSAVVQETAPETTVAEVSNEEGILSEDDYIELGTYSDFALVYLKDTSEFLCIRDGKPIGRRVHVTPSELVLFLDYLIEGNELHFGYLYEGSLIYPIFIKDFEGSISFHLQEVEKFDHTPSEGFDNRFTDARYGSFSYSIYDGKVYYLKNAEDNLFQSENFGSKYLPIVDEYISLTIAELSTSAFTKTHIFDGNYGIGFISCYTTFNDDLLVYATWKDANVSASDMRDNGLFPEYASDDGEGYIFDYWSEAKEVIDYIESGQSPEENAEGEES